MNVRTIALCVVDWVSVAVYFDRPANGATSVEMVAGEVC